MHQQSAPGAPVHLVGLGLQVRVGLVGGVTDDPRRHHQAVVVTEQLGDRAYLVGEPDPRMVAVAAPDLAEQFLLSYRIQLDLPATQ
ncbi:hypothetical protein GCM10012279_52730 [Micromonospora yangpuensis]|nr:hypothetical protein GCM10012279_52730 [Micromonospora yangpuensis]